MHRRKFLIAGGLLGTGLYGRSVRAAMFSCELLKAWVLDGTDKIPASFLPYYTQGPFGAYMNKTYQDKGKEWKPYYSAPDINIKTPLISENYESAGVQVSVDIQAWKQEWNERLKGDKSLSSYKKQGKLADYLKTIRDNGLDKLYISEITVLAEHVLAEREYNDHGLVYEAYRYEHVYPIAKFEFSEKTKPFIRTRYRRLSINSRLAVCIGISVEGNESMKDADEPLVYMLSKPTEVLSRGGCDPIDLDFS